jgi:cbb3-type cytochrome oxidase subunit 3
MIDFIAQNAATIGTVFFFSTFCYVIYSVFKKGAKKKFDQYSKIPLQDDNDGRKK